VSNHLRRKQNISKKIKTNSAGGGYEAESAGEEEISAIQGKNNKIMEAAKKTQNATGCQEDREKLMGRGRESKPTSSTKTKNVSNERQVRVVSCAIPHYHKRSHSVK